MDLYLLLPLLLFLFNLALLPWVVWGGRRRHLHLVFALFLCGMALWGLTIFLMRSSPTLEEAFIWEMGALIVIALVATVYFHFTKLFSHRTGLAWLVPGAYGLLGLFILFVPTGLVVSRMQLRFYGYAPVLGPLFYPYLFFVYLLLGLAFHNLFFAYRQATSSDERTRASYLIAATACSVIGGTTDYLPALGLPIYPLGIVGNLAFALLATVAIARHRLLEVHFALRRGVYYSLLSALLMGVLVVVLVVLNRLIHGMTALPPLIDLVAILVVAMLFQPLLRRMQGWVDRWFYRERYDALKALERFSLENRDIVELEPLASSLVSQVHQAMQAESVVLLLPSPQRRGRFTVNAYAGLPPPPLELGRRNPFILWLERWGRVASIRDVRVLPQWQAIPAHWKEALDQIGGELFVPLVMQGRLSGLLILGHKSSGAFYAQEDTDLLQTVAHQAATVIERVRLYAEAEARAREARRLEQRYRGLLHNATDAILLLDPQDGRILEANQQSLALSGYGEAELRAMTIVELVPAAERDEVAHLTEALAAGEEIRAREFHIQSKAGSLLPVEVSASLVEAEGEGVILTLLRDISERVRARQEFQRAHERMAATKADLERTLEELHDTQEQLLQAAKMVAVGRLVSGVAHELNNPLTGVLGYSELLQAREDLPQEVRQDLDRIGDEARRATRIVRNLLSFARRHQPEKRPMDIRQTLERILEFRAYDFRVNNITITTDLAPDLPTIMADQHQLEQVFLNIINNAEQAMLEAHGRGSLHIRARHGDGLVSLSFADDGPGIPAENMGRIFDPFFTTKEVGQGTGLGLSICYGIIQEHGGSIRVQSEPGKGATFVIELPLGTAPQPDPPAPQPRDQAAPLRQGRILVIDDESAIEELLQRVLCEEGYLVDGVTNSVEALRRIEQMGYDVVIVDLKMPGLSGSRLYEEVTEVQPSLSQRMIFITGDTVGEGTWQFLDEAGRPYLIKPFDMTRLKETVRLVLEGSEDA